MRHSPTYLTRDWQCRAMIRKAQLLTLDDIDSLRHLKAVAVSYER